MILTPDQVDEVERLATEINFAAVIEASKLGHVILDDADSHLIELNGNSEYRIATNLGFIRYAARAQQSPHCVDVDKAIELWEAIVRVCPWKQEPPASKSTKNRKSRKHRVPPQSTTE